MRASGLAGQLPAGRRGRPGHRAMAGLIPLMLLLGAAVACTSPSAASPAGATSAPQMRHLATAIVLEVVTSRGRLPPPPPPSAAPGRCSAGFAALSGPDADPAQCYRQLGHRVTITYAAVSSVQPSCDQAPCDHAPYYWLDVTVRAADRPAVRTIITRAHGRQLAIVIAGQAWSITKILGGPLANGLFEILVATRRQADQVLRLLGQPS